MSELSPPDAPGYKYFDVNNANVEQIQANLTGHLVKLFVPKKVGVDLEEDEAKQKAVEDESVVDRYNVYVTSRYLGDEEGFKARFSTANKVIQTNPDEELQKVETKEDPDRYPRELAPTAKHLRGKPVHHELTEEEKKKLQQGKDVFYLRVAQIDPAQKKLLSSIEFEMATPKVAEKIPPAYMETRDAQYDFNDLPVPTPPPSPVIEVVELPPPPPPPKPEKKGKGKKGKGKKGKDKKGKGKKGKKGKK